ncbi:MAG: hypothetical protein WAK40_02625 [Thermoplasmata archaeon]
MRRSVGDWVRSAVRAAVADLGVSATPAALEQCIREREPSLYAEWRRWSPDAAGRQGFLVHVLASSRPRKGAVARAESELLLWPIGTRQRRNILASAGLAPALPPDPLERTSLFLHNYGAGDVAEVVVSIAGLWQEFIPRISPGESVELEWSEERIHPSDAVLPPAEERGYPDPFNPTGDRQDARCDLRVEFLHKGRRGLLEGLLYFWPGASPTFFQQTGSPDALDRARQIR